jgi:transcriptional regulator with XRE-family HTH domain
METASTLIRTARLQAGLTQAELARRAGMPRSVLNAYERGHRDPGTEALARVLGAAGFQLRAVSAVAAQDGLAADLLRVLDRGRPLTERLRRLLADRLRPAPAMPDAARAAAPWIGVSPAERGETLVDLLELVDALPVAKREPRQRFPRLASR